MRIAIIGDASAPTPAPGGHGLGKATHAIAERLHAAGHDVTLFAAAGSQFSGSLVTPVEPSAEYWKAEVTLAKAVYDAHQTAPFQVIYDHSHVHKMAHVFPDLPVVNHIHDKWQQPVRNAVLCSEGQRTLMLKDDARWQSAKVIHHQLDADAFTPSYRADGYLLYLGVLRDYKQPILAIEAAAKVGLPLKIAGGAPFDTSLVFSGNENCQCIGMVDGEQKLELLRGATALLQFGHSESFGLSTVEAGLCGTPIVAWASGGNLDTVRDGVNGVFVKDGNVLAAIEQARLLKRQTVREYTAAMFGCPERQVEQVEQALRECIAGWNW
jgi:glycosyltransferase involved in cell wall biosynthesis